MDRKGIMWYCVCSESRIRDSINKKDITSGAEELEREVEEVNHKVCIKHYNESHLYAN